MSSLKVKSQEIKKLMVKIQKVPILESQWLKLKSKKKLKSSKVKKN